MRDARASTPSRERSSGRRRTSIPRWSLRAHPGPGEPGERAPRRPRAFAHRRKTLANSLALVGIASRERSVTALDTIGRAADVRAEALAPEEFVRLAEALGS